MGNNLSSLSSLSSSSSSTSILLSNLSFFISLRIKWIEYFISSLNENSFFDFSILNSYEKIKWKDYFKIFSNIKKFSISDKEIKERLFYHPSTIGYLMIEEIPILEIEEIEKNLPDDYTEDEASDISDEDEDEEEEDDDSGNKEQKNERKRKKDEIDTDEENEIIKQRSYQEEEERKSKKKDQFPIKSNQKFTPPKHWNSSNLSPIFFGYSQMTIQQHKETISNHQNETEKSEKRAVEKAMNTRLIALEEFEKNILIKEKIRTTKLEEIETLYEKERQRRDADLARNKKNLPEMGFKMYRVSL